MTRRLATLLKVRPGEERTVARVAALMLVAWTGFAIGGNAIESLFFVRFGPRNLPVMYIALGLITFPCSVAVGALLARASARRVLRLLPLAMALITLALRGLLALNAHWIYPVLWLSMMVLWIVLGIDTWSLAGTVHDTRQAKRLFPLYGSAVILGTAVGGLLTAPLAGWFHAENLILIWAASLVATAWVAGSLPGRPSRRRRLPGPRPRATGLLDAAREGYRYVRGSELLRWMSLAAVLLSLLYFSLSLPFAKSVTAHYPDPDGLAGFLGLFGGVTNLVALGVSVVLANRLFARWGVPTVVLGLPLIYLVGFAAAALAPGFGSVVGLRFAQLVWMNGVWLTGWQALRGVVPSERREQVRAFMDGGPTQVGIIGAGLLLLAAQAFLSTRQLFVLAAVVAVGALAAGWRVRRSYAGSLVDALRAGWPEVFIPEDEPLRGFSVDQAAASALSAGVRDPDPLVRRIAMEIVAELPDPDVVDVPVDALRDEDAGVRLAALRAVQRRRSPEAIEAAFDLLHDPDPEIRAAAADAAVAGDGAANVAERLRPLLADPNVTARVRAAAALLRSADDPDARNALGAAARSSIPEGRAAAISALGELRLEPGLLVEGLADEDPIVRRAAARGLPSFGGAVALDPLLEALADEDPTVRDAVEDALVELGRDVAGRVAEALDDHRREATALAALVRLPGADPQILRSYARTERQRALHYHRLWQILTPHQDDRVKLLVAGLRHRALRHAEHAVHAHAPLGNHAAVDLAIQDLTSRDSNQRANALETLEALTESDLVRPLLPVWEPLAAAAPADGEVLRGMLEEDDPWIRACAAFAAGSFQDPELRRAVRVVAKDDPDATVREAARGALREDGAMETLATLSLMDRVLALQQVPLFRELSPADLKRVAESVTENAYVDGTVMAEQGDPGDAMHVVVSGAVRVLVADDERGAVEVARRGPGYIVGEMSILGEQPRMANLVAVGDIRTLSIDRRRFQRILRERPDAALAVMRELSARLREAHAGRPVDQQG